ncbi:MAG: hypothetical protein ACKVS8_11385 [Phycisphaerales bacterium]
MHTRTLRHTIRLSLLGLALCAGCNNAPQGNTGGVIDPRRRTTADTFDPAADSATLLEFADVVGQELGSQIARIPDIRSSPTQVVIELGGLQNNTNTPSNDFAAVQRRVFLTLVNSDLARESARIVEQRDRMVRDAASVMPAPGDTLASQPAGSQGTMKDYPLDLTYFLQGTFSELSRGSGVQSTYVFDFTLTNASSRQIVYARQITPKQYR